MNDSNPSKRTNVPNLDSTGKSLKDSLIGEEESFRARERLLEATRPSESLIAPDIAMGRGVADNRVDPKAGFDQKVYFFPPEFHALRNELQNNYREFFETINPISGTSPAHCMVFDAAQFIGYCNGMTGLTVQLDTGDIAGICKKFLNAFRKMRGVGAIA